MIPSMRPKIQKHCGMFLFYIDDSRADGYTAFSALGVPINGWKASYSTLTSFRTSLKQSHGIATRVELHATDLLGGRGTLGTKKTIPKWIRAEIFKDTLRLIAALPGAKLLNACDRSRDEYLLLERLLNRISTCARKANGCAIVMCDEGKEIAYRRLYRKIAKINHIPSKFGTWPRGKTTKNIPTDHIVEDIFFRRSIDSHFIQLADFCAYALLRNEHPTIANAKHGIDASYDLLHPLYVLEAFGKDPRYLGIIRGEQAKAKAAHG
jgi:Protein of unknown function (DUF3800)